MNILHLCHLYYPSVGGTEVTIREISERCVMKGDSVTLFTSNAGSEEGFSGDERYLLPAGKEVIRGVQVMRFPVVPGSPGRLVSHLQIGCDLLKIPWRILSDMVGSKPCCPGMIRPILMAQPDVMLADPFVTSVVYYAYLGKKARGIPLIYHTALHLEEKHLFPRSIYKMMREADALWVNTTYEADFLMKQGIPSEKLHPLGVGVDPDRFHGADGGSFRRRHGLEDKPMVLFLGRLIRDKGIETVVEAMEFVWKKIPDVILVIAGIPTPFSQSVLREWILTSSQPGNILVFDNLPEEENKHAMDACDLFLLPSRAESFGIAYLEAWICGKPVIGARIGAVSSLIQEGVTGMLVEYGNSKDVAEKVLYLLGHPALRESMGTCGKQMVLERYTWDKITQRVRDLYQTASKL